MVSHRRTLEDRVINVRGDNDKSGRLISEFKPFIASVAQKKVERYLEYGVDDELSIGLIAFKEAMDSYDKNKGKFLSFAKLVINMRLIDYYRKQKRETALSLDGGQSDNDAVDMKSMDSYRIDEENEKRVLEIIEYRAELEKWGISLEDLAKVSPRKESLREHYKKVAGVIVKNSDILNILLQTKRLPIKEIEEIIPIHRKKLERGRIYIIAVVLALVSNFSYLNICRGGE